MFKNEYQGGAVVDIFSAQGNDPVANWKLYGSQTAISKEFDREMKGFVYILEGSSQKNRMQMPKDSRMALGLHQRFLVLQVFVPMGKDFSTELMVTDSGNLKRRLYLSTVHKELSATPLHAKIPLSSLRLNIWCNMCIDLVSFTSEIFKGAPFLSLDRIIVCASCRLRRIFTMKLQPADTYNESDLYICGNGPREIIPKICRFPPDVQHVTQLVSVSKLRMAERRLDGSLSSEPEQTNSSITARGAKNQDVCHIAFGSKVPGPPPPAGKKATGSSREVVLVSGTRIGRSCGSAKHSSGDWTEKQSHRCEPVPISGRDPIPEQQQDGEQALEGLSGTHWSLQPHPPPSRLAVERPGKRKLRVYSAEREPPVLTGAVRSSSRNEASSSETFPSPSTTAVRAGALVPGAVGDKPHADSGSFELSLKDVSSDSSNWIPERLDLQLSCDSVVQTDVATGHESNGVEPQLTLENIFTFSSRPHSARRCQGHTNPGEGPNSSPEMWGEGGGIHRGARLEDDFFGSESEEDECYSATVIQRPGNWSSPGVSPSLGLKSRIQTPEGNNQPDAEYVYYSQASESPARPSELDMDVSLGDCSGAKKTEVDHTSMVPTRCHSPNRTRLGYGLGSPRNVRASQDASSRVSLSKKSLKEIPIGDSRLHVDHTASGRASGQASRRPNRASGSETRLRGSLSNHEEELLMLASLLRQQEDEQEEVYEDGTAAGLSASQMQNCNVSISTSSDDTSTWTPYVPMPAYQGHHYQEEMSPLLQSNPRDRLNVLSPPIVPPSQQERDNETGRLPGNAPTDAEISTSMQHVEDDFLNLLYDPCLNCYFDPESGKYYELV